MQDGGADIARPSLGQRNFGFSLCSHRVLPECLVLILGKHGITKSGVIPIDTRAAQKSLDQHRALRCLAAKFPDFVRYAVQQLRPKSCNTSADGVFGRHNGVREYGRFCGIAREKGILWNNVRSNGHVTGCQTEIRKSIVVPTAKGWPLRVCLQSLNGHRSVARNKRSHQ